MRLDRKYDGGSDSRCFCGLHAFEHKAEALVDSTHLHTQQMLLWIARLCTPLCVHLNAQQMDAQVDCKPLNTQHTHLHTQQML
jgi:hypothetical protein